MQKTNEKSVSGRKRLYVAVGSTLAIGALVTAAAFTDYANINLGGAQGGGIGSADNAFVLHVAKTGDDGLPVDREDLENDEDFWVSANTDEGARYTLAGAENLVPGQTLNVSIPVRNSSDPFSAELVLSFVDKAEVTADSTLRDALRFTAVFKPAVGSAIEFIKDAPLSEASKAVGHQLDKGEEGVFEIQVSLPLVDGQDPNIFQGKTANIGVKIDAESVDAR